MIGLRARTLTLALMTVDWGCSPPAGSITIGSPFPISSLRGSSSRYGLAVLASGSPRDSLAGDYRPP